MYMRLLGYPAQKISILTTYNGQKFLIRDVLNKRCAQNPFTWTSNEGINFSNLFLNIIYYEILL